MDKEHKLDSMPAAMRYSGSETPAAHTTQIHIHIYTHVHICTCNCCTVLYYVQDKAGHTHVNVDGDTSAWNNTQRILGKMSRVAVALLATLVATVWDEIVAVAAPVLEKQQQQ